jgi:uncharacterized protein YdaU (DUF1376 family)
MNHYPHHIGDFNNATRHLTRLERSIYRDLIEFYYDIEGMLPLDTQVICRKVLARSNEEVTAVEQTLNEFFNETATGWYHVRCEEELDKYKSNASQKSLAGKASALKKAAKLQQALNTRSTDVEIPLNGTSTNQEPRTKNHKPIKNNISFLASLGVDETIAADWIALRKTKKAAVTQTAIDGVQREADKAGISLDAAMRICCERGWAGFKAEWIQEKNKNSGGVQDARLEVARQIMGDSQNGNDRSFIDITPECSIESDRASFPEVTYGIRESAHG